MDTFAEYILSEKELAAKMEIVYYLAKREKIYFNKSIIVKTELARLFLKYSKLQLDENIVLTACLLCNCKKVDNVKDFDEIKNYAKNGAKYLQDLGFDSRFCKICEEVNRYSESNPREEESDILELVEQFGGMILDRPERIGFEPDEAKVLLIHRNLKNNYNRYTEMFAKFVDVMQEINMGEFVEVKALKRLVKMYNETDGLREFIKKVINVYEPQIDLLTDSTYKKIEQEIEKNKTINVQKTRPLFTEETTRRILNDIEEKDQKVVSENI